jgi:hypothetical protein
MPTGAEKQHMSLKVIGVGVGRTGTYSLKLALNQLGLGPCHHMEEVLHNMDRQVPLWNAAVDGQPDWGAIYDGYDSAVDWPTAGFFRELLEANPTAKFILTDRDSTRWTESFSQTIYKLLWQTDEVPEPMRDWLDMARAVIDRTGFPASLSTTELKEAFLAHNEAVESTIPADQLLVFQVKQGWQPLCDFLGVPTPDEPFPRTNDRAEFWDRVAGAG